ncbi:NifB/NifX family molybdenum-iron cluster-binding protein [Bacteroidota bacterium]
MKTLISSTGNEVSSRFDHRFGKANWYCIYDDQTGNTEFIENPNPEKVHGACRGTSKLAIDLKVGKVISGHFGPNSEQHFTKKNIQMVLIDDENITIGEIIQKLKHI